MVVRSVPEAPEVQKSLVSTFEGFTVAICTDLFSEVAKHNVWNSGAYFPLTSVYTLIYMQLQEGLQLEPLLAFSLEHLYLLFFS